MSYIGKTPIVGNFQKCDALTASATADYTLQVSSTNVVPESANHMLVSLNGILQAPVTSFTVSGSTLTFASNLATGDVIDFVILLGNVLDLGTPSDATVTNAKLASDVISGETDIGGAIADADLFLLDDGAGGTLRKTAASRIKTYIGGGITEIDQWRVTAQYQFSTSATGYVTANWERNDTSGFSYLGTGMSESSGVFSFPSTGFYEVVFHAAINQYGDEELIMDISVTTNNSSYSPMCNGYIGDADSSNNDGETTMTAIIDVTDVSNVKVKFGFTGGGSNQHLKGSSTVNETYATFKKLADT